ncbi:uncharacterized protein ATC70_013148 [Mucor velutinosus]|uniref:Uncharacterized protein n=1 Tax=Mucor velutinosus TaxID=708070 RepID=A0AAN7DQZ4_9FUNG|nr:hypothetical protein ATC70_013148 [Mucor velutinosus]
MKLTNDLSLSLKSSQIVVVSPLFADWNISLLRALFLETGWITTKDSDSKLMLVPYIEAYVNDFQMLGVCDEPFQREGKYMLLLPQPAEEAGKVIYTSICFQMHCAKELSAVSKKLAFSDFLLVPSILSSKSICLPTMDEALLTASKMIITKFRDDYKMQYGINTENELSESAVSEIAIALANIAPTRWNLEGTINKISNNLRYVDFAENLPPDFKEYPTKYFLMDLAQEANTQQYTNRLCDFLHESLKNIGSIKDAPDGVRKIILDSGHLKSHHRYYIKMALLQAKLIRPEDAFTAVNIENGALPRSLKMVQVANALLPPLIQDEEESNEIAFNDGQDNDSTLLPLNSFYVQANIGERQIDFILNKVVKASLCKDPVKLFTAQERTVEMDDILVVASEIMWGHYQQLESESHLDSLITCCAKHENITLSLSHYKCFTANLTNFINNWFQNKSTLSCKELDTCHLISIDKECPCALKITHRMLLEIGLKPVVSIIAETIVGTTLSSDHFGLYPVSALFVKRGVGFVDNVYCSDCLQHHLEEKLAEFFQNHQQKPAMCFVDKEAEHALKQFLVKGNYKQIAGSTYTISMKIETEKSSFTYELLDDYRNAYQDIPGTYSRSNLRRVQYFNSEYTILKKDKDLPSTGFKRIFFLLNRRTAVVTLNIQLPAHTFQLKVIQAEFVLGQDSCYISIAILPLLHSSAMRVTLSCFGASSIGEVFEEIESIEIQERLHLKRK